MVQLHVQFCLTYKIVRQVQNLFHHVTHPTMTLKSFGVKLLCTMNVESRADFWLHLVLL